ncbi:cysteine hydrolase family protein [Brachybacterium aquaticum]|uniref:Nicotinamidase-related amidase n=1 Tax=Brachybacterium aquaticum TaxID=1432564 RepID=A0A841ACL0_9MICO|nr:isochorismatase family cysteine hydrolase [Brachybacterium aquaticum]MBB5831371.1 nicotinamidase-related amidase [Brachybacterium aquaticum]
MSIEKTTDALLLVDLQEAFFADPTLDRARPALVDAATTLMSAARRHDMPIIVVTTEHSRDRSTWTLTMLDDDKGFLFHGDPGTKILHELDTTGAMHIEKTRDSAWFGTDLLLRVRNLGIHRIVLAGVSTHACITQTARDAFANNVRTTVVTDAVADHDEAHKEPALSLLAADRQAQLATVAEVLDAWDSLPRSEDDARTVSARGQAGRS